MPFPSCCSQGDEPCLSFQEPQPEGHARVLPAAREDLHHPRERRDAVERALRPLRDLDAVDVLDGDLRERRVERAAGGHAVHRHEERVELLEAPHPEVREARAAVRPAARPRRRRRSGARPGASGRPCRRSSSPVTTSTEPGDVHRVLGRLRGRDDHLGGRRRRRDARGLGARRRERGTQAAARARAKRGFTRTMLTKLRA